MDKLNTVLDGMIISAGRRTTGARMITSMEFKIAKEIISAMIEDLNHLRGRNAAITRIIKELEESLGKLGK